MYKKHLISVDEIYDYLRSVNDEDIDFDNISDQYRGCRAVLKEVSISDLTLGPANNNMLVNKKQMKYNKMDQSSMPPIFIDNGVVVDGHHRIRASIYNKKTTILAYVIEDAE